MTNEQVVGLTLEEVETVLTWAAATDFEAKIDESDVPVIDKLAGVTGRNPEDFYGVYMACRTT